MKEQEPQGGGCPRAPASHAATWAKWWGGDGVESIRDVFGR